MLVAAVIVAAGRGVRAGQGTPKQWRPLAGKTSVDHSLDAFSSHPDIEHLVLVLHPDDIAVGTWAQRPGIEVVDGGDTRSASVLAGLQILEGRCDRVLIHDAARPCVTHSVINSVIEALRYNSAAAPAVPVVDALWRGNDGQVAQTVDRDGLYRAQTPQGFDFKAILAAHHACPEGAADDVELVRKAGLTVAIAPGSEDNLKITMPEDFERAERILRTRNGH